MGLQASAFPMDLPSPGLMPIPDVSQPPQTMTGAAGRTYCPLSIESFCSSVVTEDDVITSVPIHRV